MIYFSCFYWNKISQRKRSVNEKLLEQEKKFRTKNNNKKYKFEAIIDSIIYVKEENN